MSSIKYSAELDIKKIEKAIQESTKLIKNWAKDIEKESKQADKGIDNMNVSLKEQKQIIKDIERDVKALQKAYDDAIAGRAKMAAGKELNAAKRALEEEKAMLISLQNQQVIGNSQVEKSTEGVIGKIGRMAIAYVSVAAVVKVLKETVLSFFTKSQEGIDLFERKINGLKAAVSVLQGEFIKLGKSIAGEKGDEATPWGTRIVTGIRVLLTTANFIPGVKKYFDDLAKSMNEAGEAAENYTRINQELEDAERAMIVPRAKANAEIVKARLLYADDSKSGTVRIAALEKALKLEEETAQEEIRHQQWVILNIRDQNIELEKRGQLRNEDRKKLEEAIAEEINLQKESDQRQVLATNSLMTLRKEFHDQEIKQLKELQQEYTNLAKTIEKTDPGRGYSLLNRSLIRSGKTPATGTELIKGGPDNFKLATSSIEWNKKMQKAIADNDKEQIKSLEKQLELRNEIVYAAAGLVSQIGQQIGLDEKSMSMLNAGLDAFTAIATKGAAGLPEAAFAMLSSIISQIPTSAERFQAQIEHINSLLAEQSRLIEQSMQRGNQEQVRKDELEYLKQLKTIQEAEQARLRSKKMRFGIGWENLQEVNAALKETNDLIEKANEALSEFYTDTTAASIADAIAQGFQEGKTSLADFADTFNEFMIKAINASLEEMSRPEIAAWYQKFAADMASGGGLSAEEISQLKINWDEIIKVGKAQRDAVYAIAGISPTAGTAADKGLSLGIQRSITEETGTELTGLWRRSSDDIRQMKDYSLIGMQNLTKIEMNTYNTVTELQKAVAELQAINTNTKQVPVTQF